MFKQRKPKVKYYSFGRKPPKPKSHKKLWGSLFAASVSAFAIGKALEKRS